jgi:hypothetical protein
MIETLSSNNPSISFASMNFTVQTAGNVVSGNVTSISLQSLYMNVACQMIFNETQSTITRTSKGPLEMFFNLNAQSEIEINFYVSVFEYPKLVSDSATKAGLNGLLMNNTKSYAEKVVEFPLNTFDYHQAIANLNASYIAIRDYSQIERFADDPMFKLVFMNDEVAIFQI